MSDPTKTPPAATPPAATPPATPPETPAVPEKYDLKLPTDSPLNAAHLESTASYAKELGLSNEKAQKLLERDNAVLTAFLGEQKKELERKSVEWVETAKSDKEIGGEAFKENVEHAHRALEKFAPESFRKLLEETGYGNHPDLVRTFSRIGRAMADDKIITSSSSSGGEKRVENVFYPSKS